MQYKQTKNLLDSEDLLAFNIFDQINWLELLEIMFTL